MSMHGPINLTPTGPWEALPLLQRWTRERKVKAPTARFVRCPQRRARSRLRD